ncbi:phosphotransferase [Streptomyces badius]
MFGRGGPRRRHAEAAPGRARAGTLCGPGTTWFDRSMIIEPSLVRGLIAAQFPHWADLPVEAVDASGTANAIYRLGADKAVRLPRTEGSAADVATEHRWLPRLAERLPFPCRSRSPKESRTRRSRALVGLHLAGRREPGPRRRLSSSDFLAADLAECVLALRRVDPAQAPPAYRSEPLASRDATTREALASLAGIVDAEVVAAAWNEALSAPPFAAAPVWVHGDLQPGNVLVADGRLAAVIDFGCTGLADPAVDLIAAWYLLTAGARETFRTAVAADDATWARGRGWALSIALLELAHYRETNPVMARIAAQVIEEIVT